MIHNSFPFVFFGTDDFSVIVLEELKKAGLLPALIVTVLDRPKGRGLVVTSSPAKLWALENGIDCFQPARLDSSATYKLKTISYKLFIVASYGLIIPKDILNIPSKGTLNVHPSLLPKYRGATPIERQILNDEKEVGVTIMLMDEEMDHGPIVAQRVLQIPNHKNQIPNGAELRKMLAQEGGKLLAEVMPGWVEGKIEQKPQDHLRATYTKKLLKTDGEINLSDDPFRNFLRIQAFDGSIGTYFLVEQSGRKVRVLIKGARMEAEKLCITRVVPEGKKEMSYEEFLRGFTQK